MRLRNLLCWTVALACAVAGGPVAEARPPERETTQRRAPAKRAAAKKPVKKAAAKKTAKKTVKKAAAKKSAKKTTAKRGASAKAQVAKAKVTKAKGKRGKHKVAKNKRKKHRAIVKLAKPDPHAPPLDAYRVTQTYAEVRRAADKAKRRLLYAEIGTEVVGGLHAVLAVWNPDLDPKTIKLVHVRDGTSQTLGFDVEPQVWNGLSSHALSKVFNGVNTYYKVFPKGWVVLALKTNTRREPGAIYVPYNPAYQTPSVVQGGRDYLTGVIDRAQSRLERAGVMSRAKPGLGLTEAVNRRVMDALMVIEHTDAEEFATRGGPWVSDKVYVTLALNREKTYAHAISTANAGGIAQFIPSTYRAMRDMYPDAGLPADFTDGTSDHVTAAMAQYCLLDYSLSVLLATGAPEPPTPELLGAYLAAAYNSGEGRAVPAYASHVRSCHRDRDRREWCEKPHDLPGETQNYLVKFAATYRYLYPSDTEEDEAADAPPAPERKPGAEPPNLPEGNLLPPPEPPIPEPRAAPRITQPDPRRGAPRRRN